MTARWFAPDHPIRQAAVPLADQSGWSTQMRHAQPLRLALDAYSVPVRDASTASYRQTFTQHQAYMSQLAFYGDSPASGPMVFGGAKVAVPWRPEWFPPDTVGNDRIVIVADPRSGEVWELWIVDWAWRFLVWHSSAVVAASIRHYPDGLTRGYQDGRVVSRGCGLEKLAGVLLVEELEEAVRSGGTVGHALSITVPNSRIGNAFWRGTATRNEISTLELGKLGGVITRVRPDSETMPSGTRWRLNWSESEIWAHAALFAGGSVGLARTLAAILRTMTVEGVFAGETGGETSIRCHVETDRHAGNAVRWSTLGIGGDDLNSPWQRCLGAIPPEAWQICEPAR